MPAFHAGLSIAGYRKGFEDVRGTIFFDIVRIACDAEPAVLLLENVENLSRHDSGRTFEVILQTLKDLGYNVNPTVLNSRDFGMIQMRKRTIIVCFKNAEAFKRFNFNLPHGGSTPRILDVLDAYAEIKPKYFIEKDSWLAKNYIDKIVNKENPGYIYQFRRQYWRECSGRCPTLTANMGTGGHNVPFIFDSEERPRRGASHIES